LPAESIFSLALEHDPSLIEEGVRQSIIVASPTTLIALLRAAHYGWQQEAVAENAQKISELGRDIYERLQVLAEHFTRLGRGLDNAVDYYNKAVRSLETRVLPAARRFPDLTAESGKTIPEIRPVERTAIGLQAPELVETAEENEHEPED